MNFLVIAANTYREGIRKKTLIGFLIVALLVIGGSTFLTVLSPGEEVKMVKDVCLAALSMFGVLIAIFTAGSMVPSEVENKTIYTVLSKPLRRFDYIVGKFVGIQFILILNLGLMALLSLAILFTREHVLSTILIKSVFLTYLELMVLSAFTFAVSMVSSSAVLPIICGAFIYIIGHLVEYLKGLSNHAVAAGHAFLAGLIKLLYLVLPDLSNFNLRDQLIHLQPNDPRIGVIMWRLVAYALANVAVGILIAHMLFRRKEV
ncbi:MAG: ABC transporter permease subunit [Candidatus Hydrogenedentes bacterium]|nr:ABC transporter permease subunit [Candidatus Hydrogenedentota bacterium]